MEIVSTGEWSTDFKGDRFRVLVIDKCTGCKFEHSHFLQYEGETVARCMNGGTVIDVPTDNSPESSQSTETGEGMSATFKIGDSVRNIIKGWTGSVTLVYDAPTCDGGGERLTVTKSTGEVVDIHPRYMSKS